MATFNPDNFKIFNTNEMNTVNYYSMGYSGGNFRLDAPQIPNFYSFVASPASINYCMVEKKTDFFKLLWDFDIPDKKGEWDEFISITDFNIFWNDIIETLIKVMKEYINEPDNKFRYIYSDRKDKKYKLHIYFPDIVIDRSYAIILANELIRELKECKKYDEKLIDKLVDKSIFKENGIRLLFQRKKGETGYYKINIEKSTYKNIPESREDQLRLTSIRTGSQGINFKTVLDPDMGVPKFETKIDQHTIINNKNKLERKIDEHMYSIQPKKIQEGPNSNVDIIKKNVYDMNLVRALAHNLKYSGPTDRLVDYSKWRDFIFLCRNYGWKELAHEISRKVPSKYDKKEVERLLRTKPKTKLHTFGSLMFWSKSDNEEEHNKILEKFPPSIMQPLTYTSQNSFKKVATTVYEKRYVDDLNVNNYDSFIVKSATGTNKSGCVIKAIDQLIREGKANSVTCICSRVVLVANLFGRFQAEIDVDGKKIKPDLKIAYYKDIDPKKLYKEKRIIITPDSLIRMTDPQTYKVEVPDILFIDEIESLFNYVCTADTINNTRKQIFTLINHLIKNAKYIFCVDSNVTSFVCEYIKSLRKNNKFDIIYNTKKTSATNYYLLNEECMWEKQLLAHINEGKKIFICADSKTKCDEMMSKLKDKVKCMIYTCDTSDKDKYDLRNVNDLWVLYDVVICSPTILYGIDMNVIHFDYVYGFYNGTIDCNSVYQQINRIREIKSGEVYIHFSQLFKSIHPLPVGKESISNYLLRYREEFDEIIEKLLDDEEYDRLKDDRFTSMYIHFLKKTHKCKNNYEIQLCKHLTEFGGSVYKKQYILTPKVIKEKETHKEEKTKLKDELNTIIIDKLVKSSEMISKASEISLKKRKTEEDNIILKASNICYKTGLKKLDSEVFEGMKHLKCVDKMHESKIFLLNEQYQKAQLTSAPIDVKYEKLYKMKSLIDSGLKIFFKDGLLSDKKITIATGDNRPEEERTKDKKAMDWFTKNKEDIIFCFSSVRSNRLPKDRMQVIKMLDKMMNDFFGGFVRLNISERQEKRVKGVKYGMHEVDISQTKYIELLLLKHFFSFDAEALNKIKKSFANDECTHVNLHGYKTIGDIIRNKEEIKRMHETRAEDFVFAD